MLLRNFLPRNDSTSHRNVSLTNQYFHSDHKNWSFVSQGVRKSSSNLELPRYKIFQKKEKFVGIKIFLNRQYRIETMKENFHSINGDISMRACMFCGRNLFASIHYRYCSTELHRKSDSLICYKCEQASKKGKLKSVIEKLRKVLKTDPDPNCSATPYSVFSLAIVQGVTFLTQMTLQHEKSLVNYIFV